MKEESGIQEAMEKLAALIGAVALALVLNASPVFAGGPSPAFGEAFCKRGGSSGTLYTNNGGTKQVFLSVLVTSMPQVITSFSVTAQGKTFTFTNSQIFSFTLSNSQTITYSCNGNSNFDVLYQVIAK